MRCWDFIIPGRGGTSTSSRGAIFAARWVHESQPTVKLLPVLLLMLLFFAGAGAGASASALMRNTVRWWMQGRGVIPPHRTVGIGQWAACLN